MRWNDFRRALVFAAAVAVAWPALSLVAVPVLGVRTALSWYIVGTAALCAWGIAPDRIRGTGAALATAAGGALALVLASSVGVVAVGAALALGVARSAFLYRRRVGRTLLLEMTLIGVGLAIAWWLATPGPLGIALALWGFFAVQAGFFTIGSAREQRIDGGADRFECARRRALALLEE